MGSTVVELDASPCVVVLGVLGVSAIVILEPVLDESWTVLVVLEHG